MILGRPAKPRRNVENEEVRETSNVLLRSLRIFLVLLFILALIAAAVFSQSTQPAQPPAQPAPDQEQPAPGPTPTPTPAEPTLNLHRWGAVTMFHGLPSDRINAIAQDARGLLWFGTDNGLVSYYGRNVEAVPGSLPSHRILALQLDARGDLWIGTDAGAARLHNNHPEILAETRGRAITAIAVSAQNEVALVTTSGEILRYRENKGVYSVASRSDRNSQPLLKSSNPKEETLPLMAVSYTRSGELAIGSSGRGALIDKGGALSEAAVRPPRPYFVSAILTVGERIWIGERSNQQAGALWFLDKGKLVKSAIKTGAVNAIQQGALQQGALQQGALQNSDGELWVGTTREGAFLLNSEGKDVKEIEHLTFDNTAGGLRSNHINAIFRDREGVVWFGTDRGICRYDRDSFRAENVSYNPQSNFIRSLLHTSSSNGGEIYSGTNRGLFRSAGTESDRGSWTEVTQLQGQAIYALFEDAAGSIWAGTDSGVYLKPKDSHLFSVFSTEPVGAEPPNENAENTDYQTADAAAESSRTRSRESVRALTGFRGAIYAAIFGRGIVKLEATPESNDRTTVLNSKIAKGATCLAAEGDRALWFGTIDGEVARYDGAQTVTYTLPKKPSSDPAPAIWAIRIAGDRVWLASSQGLYVRDGNSIRAIKPKLDVRDLLVEGDIIWCATRNEGLIKFMPANDIYIRFDTEQGLTSEQVFALAERNGEILIGTNRGVVRHRPSPIEPRIQATRLVAPDRIYEADELAGELLLNYPQQHFLLEVTGIGTRTFLSQFQYEFVLRNSDGQQLSRFLSHEPSYPTPELKAGVYTIAARAISRDLVYSAPLLVRVRIGKAPFPTLQFLLSALLGVALAAAVWAFRQQRRLGRVNRKIEETNAELHETRLRLAHETEAERSRIARDLHDQTLSDLRHLLVLTDRLRAPNNYDVSPSLLRRKIESISSEIRHICEDLSPSALENIGFLPALEWALNNVVSNLTGEEKFGYEFICDPELEDRLRLSQIEKIQLYRIVQEALNNIGHHAHARQVKMIVRIERGNELVIVIEDDGIGFDGTSMNATGYGLANIRSRANLIGAQVKWKKVNPGCRFEVMKAGVVASA